MKPAIEIKELGKKYRIRSNESYLALRDVITRNIKTFFNPQHDRKEDFWALQDINLTIEQGERIGIIGKNGAGKSTLLKILSRVTWPTKGEAIIRGRLASLLEVGTGFHPELTGRDNIFFNGSILGLKKTEIIKQFDAIVDFSGVEKFLDTPLKHYSSGMQLRLAFAVAAHLEPEVLLIDEVLAVGDMEFQKKCLGKMEEVSKQHGRTILFVSHDLSAISTLTNKSLLLNAGKLIEFNNTSSVIQTYSSNFFKNNLHYQEIDEDKPAVTKVEILTSEGGALQAHSKALLINFEIYLPYSVKGMALSLQIFNHINQPVTYNWLFDNETLIFKEKGLHKISIKYDRLQLYQGNYFLRIHLAEIITKNKFQQFDCCPFEVTMIDKTAPEWGWQTNVCQYLEEGTWYVNEQPVKNLSVNRF